MRESQNKKWFGIILYSKVNNEYMFNVTAGNLRRFFRHLIYPELVKHFYFVDDSEGHLRDQLLGLLYELVHQYTPSIKIVTVIDNGSIYNAVNRVWSLVNDPYIISLNSDFATIQDIPLDAMLKAMEMYPDVYLINLKTRRLFGYNDAKDELRRKFPMWRHLRDDVQETWYFLDEKGRLFSIPATLFPLQRKCQIHPYYWGVELVPRPIDENHTLWTPKFPSKLMLVQPTCTHFIGGSVIYRTDIIKRYLPLPKRYQDKGPAYCKEVYFWRDTDIDAKYYVGWLNLQVFIVHFGDPASPQNDIQEKYWGDFIDNNCIPVICKNAKPWRVPRLAIGIRRLLLIHRLNHYILNVWAKVLESFFRKVN